VAHRQKLFSRKIGKLKLWEAILPNWNDGQFDDQKEAKKKRGLIQGSRREKHHIERKRLHTGA